MTDNDLVLSRLSEINAQFFAVILYPREVVAGEVVRLVVWFPTFIRKVLTLENLKKLASYHPVEHRDVLLNCASGPCLVFDVRPRTPQEILESVYSLKANVMDALHLNSEPMTLRDMAEINKLLIQINAMPAKENASRLH